MPFLPPGKQFAGDTAYKDDYSKRKVRVFQQAGMKPTSAFRRNNPHPNPDFLMPKNLIEQNKEQKLQSQVTVAVQKYMDKMIRAGKDPPREPYQQQYQQQYQHEYQQQQRSRPVRTEKERYALGGGNSCRDFKTYGEVVTDDETTEEEQDEIVVRIPAKVWHPTTKTIHYTVVRKPEAPVEHWITHGGNIPSSSGVKRLHTPPTPPTSASYDRRLHRHMRSKSAPALDQTDSKDGEWVDVTTDGPPGLVVKRPDSAVKKIQRPKTAGPVLATKLMVHPRMKSWMKEATDYEKNVAMNLLKTLHGNERPPSAPTDGELRVTDRSILKQQQKSKVKATRIPAATHIYIPPSPALRKPVPERDGTMDATTKEWMRKLDSKIDRAETPLQLNYTQKIEVRDPRNRRQHQPRSLGDYTHEKSFFGYSQPSYRRSFVIAPDWVSETMTRRKVALPKKQTSNQLQYSSI